MIERAYIELPGIKFNLMPVVEDTNRGSTPWTVVSIAHSQTVMRQFEINPLSLNGVDTKLNFKMKFL